MEQQPVASYGINYTAYWNGSRAVTVDAQEGQAAQRRQLRQLNIAECRRVRQPQALQPWQLRDRPNGIHQHMIVVAVDQPREAGERRQVMHSQVVCLQRGQRS